MGVEVAETPNLEFRPIGSDTLVLIVAPGHPWAARKRIALDVLTGEPLILPMGTTLGRTKRRPEPARTQRNPGRGVTAGGAETPVFRTGRPCG